MILDLRPVFFAALLVHPPVYGRFKKREKITKGYVPFLKRCKMCYSFFVTKGLWCSFYLPREIGGLIHPEWSGPAELEDTINRLSC